jgi:hypothetical protein
MIFIFLIASLFPLLMVSSLIVLKLFPKSCLSNYIRENIITDEDLEQYD